MRWNRKAKLKGRGRGGCDGLSPMPSDVMVSVLSFLTVDDVDTNVKLVCKALRRECQSKALWKSFCGRTGKLEKSTDDLMDCSNDSAPMNPYRIIYYRIPCVPVDFDSIAAALNRCPKRGTITLMPGVYEERVVIRKEIHLRAAFPQTGAAIAWYQGLNQPCVTVSGDDYASRKMHVMLSHLQLLHSTGGSDIWGGNCAVMVEGDGACLALASCSLQSDSGRGVVAVDGATLHLHSTVIHDCAATGVYLGDVESVANIKSCNIIRNGSGSRRTQGDDTDEDEADRVPPGHSGMYVEAGMALVEDSLVAGNSLTGLSVVRGGVVRISGCDVTENGSDPILVEDAFDFDQSEQQNPRRQGGVVEGPHANNYSSHGDDMLQMGNGFRPMTINAVNKAENSKKGTRAGRIVLGGRMRDTQFENAVEKLLTSRTLSTFHPA